MKRFTNALMLAMFAGVALAQPTVGPATPAGTNGPDENPPSRFDSMPPVNPNPGQAPQIQLAILLDTSGSMDGLIEQAKAQLWTIVNELASTTRNEQRPELYVSLFEYGKQTIAPDEGYIRMILPLTRDLDAVSQELFALQTNGGDEYCGWVIRSATQGLAWNTDPSVLKMIVIAGNEPFSQGDVDFHQTVPEAIAKGIVVNTIFCGDRTEGINTGWEEGAKLADGTYSHIDQNQQIEQITSPQDEEIQALNLQLNGTYLGYGMSAAEGMTRQLQADEDAKSNPVLGAQIIAERAATKAQTAAYCNSTWDLVDACRDDEFDLTKVPDDQLPEAMRGKTLEEKQAYVAELTAKRADIQSKILALVAARDKYVAEVRRTRAEEAGHTLGDAICRAVREQAERSGFTPREQE